MDHHWVAKAWLSDMGLPQYSQAFHNHLVDGRLLNSLTRRDLERHLNITKKFHQVSLLLGIELLHLLNFDKEVSRNPQTEGSSEYTWLCSNSRWKQTLSLIKGTYYNGFQALQARRIQCEHQNVDPLVWTSHRVIKWIRDIDLKVGAQGRRMHLWDWTHLKHSLYKQYCILSYLNSHPETKTAADKLLPYGQMQIFDRIVMIKRY